MVQPEVCLIDAGIIGRPATECEPVLHVCRFIDLIHGQDIPGSILTVLPFIDGIPGELGKVIVVLVSPVVLRRDMGISRILNDHVHILFRQVKPETFADTGNVPKLHGILKAVCKVRKIGIRS